MNSDLLLVELLVYLHRLRLVCFHFYTYNCAHTHMCVGGYNVCVISFLKLNFSKSCSCMYLNIYLLSNWFWSSYLYFHYLIGKWNGILLCKLVNVQTFHSFINLKFYPLMSWRHAGVEKYKQIKNYCWPEVRIWSSVFSV